MRQDSIALADRFALGEDAKQIRPAVIAGLKCFIYFFDTYHNAIQKQMVCQKPKTKASKFPFDIFRTISNQMLSFSTPSKLL
jgi:hypothetical protein